MIASQCSNVSRRRVIGCRRVSTSLSDILRRVRDGDLGIDDADALITGGNKASPDRVLLSFANLDHDRATRTGFPEAVFAAGKTPNQVASILDDMAKHVNLSIADDRLGTKARAAILATRVSPEQYREIAKIPLEHGKIHYHETARIVSMKASAICNEEPIPPKDAPVRNRVVVACAGTTDLPVAEEAAVTLEAVGCEVERVYDAGVAGLHRIINALPRLRDPSVGCVIVCAGMDGALPSVVAGLIDVPVIATPTSGGYGVSFGGVSAVMTMLNSCAPGVGVVNIDNGFGAAALAYKIIR